MFLNYSLLNGNLLHNASGWEVGGTSDFNVTSSGPLFGIQGVFSAHHQSVSQGHFHLHDLMLGPTVQNSFGSFTLSGHALAGLAHTGGELGSHNGFSTAVGGNLVWDISPVLGLRVAGVDWYQAHVSGSSQNVRFSAGVVFRLIGFFDPPRYPKPAPKSDYR